MCPNPQAATSAASPASPPPAESQGSAAPAATSASSAAAPASTESAESAAAATTEAAGTAASGTDDAAAGTTEVPTWKPNYKFKFAKADSDEQEEKEFDELVRGVVKDEASEKLVRDLYERAYGLDGVKARQQKVREELDETRTGFMRNLQGQRELGGLLTKRNFRKFFELTKVPVQDVFKWVMEEAKYDEAPPEEKARIDRERRAQEDAEQATAHARDADSRFQEQAVRTRTVELKIELAKPDVSDFANRFDATAGKPGSFVAEIVRIARQAWRDEEIDLPVEEAVNRAMQHYGRFLGAQTSVPGGSPAGTGQSPAAPSAPREVPVIPKVQGGGQSPTRTGVKNLDDLKKLSAQAKQRRASAANP